jgi:hypothetical protein
VLSGVLRVPYFWGRVGVICHYHWFKPAQQPIGVQFMWLM